MIGKKKFIAGLATGLLGAFLTTVCSNPVNASTAPISESSKQIFIPPYKGFLPIEQAAQKSLKIAPLLAIIDKTDIYNDDYKSFHDTLLSLMVEWARVSGVPGWKLNQFGEIPKDNNSQTYDNIRSSYIYVISRTICFKDINNTVCGKDRKDISKNKHFMSLISKGKETPELYQDIYYSNKNLDTHDSYNFDEDKANSYSSSQGISKYTYPDIDTLYLNHISDDMYLYNIRDVKDNRVPPFTSFPKISPKSKKMLRYIVNDGCCDSINYYNLVPGYKRLKTDTPENAWKAFHDILRYSDRDIGSEKFKSDSIALFKKAPISILNLHFFVMDDKYEADLNKYYKLHVMDAFINTALGSDVKLFSNRLLINVKDDGKYVVSIRWGALYIITGNSKNVEVLESQIKFPEWDREDESVLYNGVPVNYGYSFISYGIKNINYNYLYDYRLTWNLE